VSVDLVI